MQNNKDENLKDALKKAVTEEPNPNFIYLLEQRLLTKAPDYLRKKSFFNPLFMFFRFSHKFSSALVASVLVVAITAGVAFHMHQNGPQEIINKAYAYYESASQKNAIYYEKNYHEYEIAPGEGMKKSISELWQDDLGNTLNIESDALTGAIESAGLIKINSAGQAKIYDNLPLEESPNTQPFLEENFYCVEFYKHDGMKSNTTLMISAQDPSFYNLSGWSESEEQETELTDEQKFEIMIEDLESGNSSPEQTQLILQTLKVTNDLQDQEITENGKNYHVFTMNLKADVEIHYYINSETYKLEKMIENWKDTKETIFSVEYLESKYLDNSEAQNIFDPAKYNLHPTQMLEAGNPSNLIENGCYKTNGDKMTAEEEKEFWLTLPPSAKTDMEEFKKDTIENSFNRRKLDPVQMQNSAINLRLNLETPLKGGITQFFTSGHSGVDFASMLSEEPVIAADDGIVSFVSSNNSWNGGRQNTVIIDHGDGIQTSYSKLGVVNVKKDDKLKKGDKLATVKEGDENGFIHFELLLNGESINPQKNLAE